MCGIIGVTGEADAVPLLLGALHQLEYRGYDSAGIAMVVDGDGGADTIWRVRAAGGTSSVAKLAELAADAPRGHAAAIGHTRWATHGSPTTENAHPHTDCTGRVAIIHNGIIENHAELRTELVAAGHTLTSATDTEVMAHLIEQELAAGASLAEATRTMLRRVRGAFSIAVVCADEPDTDRGRPPFDAARARAARPHGPVGVGHPRPDRAHAARLRIGRRRAGRARGRARSR